jgi:hypothetical protein
MSFVLLLASISSASSAPASDWTWPTWRDPASEPHCDDGPVPVFPTEKGLKLDDRIKIEISTASSTENGGPCSFTVLVNPAPGRNAVSWSAEERLHDKTIAARWAHGTTTILSNPASSVERSVTEGRPGEWVEIGTWGVLDGEVAVRLNVGGVLQYPVYVSSSGRDLCNVSIH